MAAKRLYSQRRKLAEALIKLKNYDANYAQQISNDVADIIRYTLLSGEQLIIGDMRIERRVLENGTHKPYVTFQPHMHEIIRQEGNKPLDSEKR